MRLFLLGVFLLVVGVPAAMVYTYFINAWAVRVMIGMALVAGICLLISGIVITITKKLTYYLRIEGHDEQKVEEAHE